MSAHFPSLAIKESTMKSDDKVSSTIMAEGGGIISMVTAVVVLSSQL